MRTQTLVKTRWDIDPVHSRFGFSIGGIYDSRVSGAFSETYVMIYSDSDDFTTAEIEVRINAASLSTGDAALDSQLKGPGFLDVDNYRQIVFIGKNPVKKGKNRFSLQGLLSLRDNAKPVQLDLEYAGIIKDESGVEKAKFIVTGQIDRYELRLKPNDPPGKDEFPYGDKVFIDCDIRLVRENIG